MTVFVENFSAGNDAAERGVKDIQDYDIIANVAKDKLLVIRIFVQYK